MGAWERHGGQGPQAKGTQVLVICYEHKVTPGQVSSKQ